MRLIIAAILAVGPLASALAQTEADIVEARTICQKHRNNTRPGSNVTTHWEQGFEACEDIEHKWLETEVARELQRLRDVSESEKAKINNLFPK